MAGLCARQMSKPWRPDEDSTPLRTRGARGWARLKREWREETRQRKIPSNAVAALGLLAAACLGAAILLYALAGPIDVFEGEAGSDWSAVDGPRR